MGIGVFLRGGARGVLVVIGVLIAVFALVAPIQLVVALLGFLLTAIGLFLGKLPGFRPGGSKR